MTRPPVVLSIAGSDPSGGAGIQADLKTFSALGAYGCAALTALTAQSTQGVTGVHRVPAAFVTEQVLTLVDDVRLDAVKIGMLSDVDVVRAVTTLVQERLDCPVVLDPVMVSTAGSRLLEEDAVAAVTDLVPHVDAITPNLPEAAMLLGVPQARDVDEMRQQAQALVASGARRVLLKGGHHEGQHVVDVWADPLADPGDPMSLVQERVDTRHTHGTGCTLSSAIAALLPQRDSWLEAVRDAKTWLTRALQHGDVLAVGSGAGPVHHFHALWPPDTRMR